MAQAAGRRASTARQHLGVHRDLSGVTLHARDRPSEARPGCGGSVLQAEEDGGGRDVTRSTARAGLALLSHLLDSRTV